jgi:hypothetical protein
VFCEATVLWAQFYRTAKKLGRSLPTLHAKTRAKHAEDWERYVKMLTVNSNTPDPEPFCS